MASTQVRPRYPRNIHFNGESSHEDNGESEQGSRGRYAGWGPSNTGALQARFSESSREGRAFGRQIASEMDRKKKPKKKRTQLTSHAKSPQSAHEAFGGEPQCSEPEKPWIAVIVLVILLAILVSYSLGAYGDQNAQSAQSDQPQEKKKDQAAAAV